MFAGIVETVGRVVALDASPRAFDGTTAHRLTIELGVVAGGAVLGASIAVNGVCLTLARINGTIGEFHVIPETWRLTNLHALAAGSGVNLERSLRVGDRIDGHFVQGHIDGVGRVVRVETRDGEWKTWIRSPADLRKYIVRKGAIAVDGTSLTIADVHDDEFSVALIPTTLERTVLRDRKSGDSVNLETDVVARLVVSRLDALGINGAEGERGEGGADRLNERLRAAGFLA